MENIRITSGNLRGRSIKSPRSSLTHPMGSREKLALLNMVAGILPGARVLDAFAGSGALGIEAISRGASYAVFVEKAPKVARVIKENLASLGISEKAEVICEDASSFTSAEKFQLIIADPPYDKFQGTKLDNLAEMLDNEGILALSHPGEAPEIAGLKLLKTSAYANARISLYRQ